MSSRRRPSPRCSRTGRGPPSCGCSATAPTACARWRPRSGERENNVSNHLAKLRDAGLVRASRHEANGRFLYYERDEAATARALAALTDVLA